MKIMSSLGYCLILTAICGLGCKTASVTSERELAPAPTAKPIVVYVSDFEIGVIKHQEGILSSRPGPVGRVGERLSGSSASDPATRAQQLVDLMANSLVKELAKSGFNATRLPPGNSVPAEGWLLRGVFTEVQEGNRLRRAMVGFGQGETDIQVIAAVDDLSHGPPKPLYEVATDASSGNKPGAGATLALNPYAAAARFVMAKHDLANNVRQTAAKIAEQMTQRIQGASSPSKG